MLQDMSDTVAQDIGKVSSASSIPHSIPAHASILAMPPSSDPNYHPTTAWMPTVPSPSMHRAMPGTPGPLG